MILLDRQIGYNFWLQYICRQCWRRSQCRPLQQTELSLQEVLTTHFISLFNLIFFRVVFYDISGAGSRVWGSSRNTLLHRDNLRWRHVHHRRCRDLFGQLKKTFLLQNLKKHLSQCISPVQSRCVLVSTRIKVFPWICIDLSCFN